MRIRRAETMTSRPITVFESKGASIVDIARTGQLSVVRIELQPGGLLGMHPASSPQLFVVVEGTGTVRTEREAPRDVSAGTSVWWGRGEMHETRSETGLTAIVVEGESLSPATQALGADSRAT